MIVKTQQFHYMWKYFHILTTMRGQNNIKFHYNLLLQGYMFRLLRVIIRPSNEPTQDYLLPSALWDPVALTIGGVIVL